MPNPINSYTPAEPAQQKSARAVTPRPSQSRFRHAQGLYSRRRFPFVPTRPILCIGPSLFGFSIYSYTTAEIIDAVSPGTSILAPSPVVALLFQFPLLRPAPNAVLSPRLRFIDESKVFG